MCMRNIYVIFNMLFINQYEVLYSTKKIFFFQTRFDYLVPKLRVQK